MNLSIATKEMFGQNEMNIYQNENNDIFMTREQIGQALEYAEPNTAIRKIHYRNKERLDRFSVGTRLVGTDGKRYLTTIYNEKGIYEITRFSKQPKADEFYDWVYELLSSLRKNELKIQPKSNLEILQMTVNELATQDKRLSYLEDHMRIDGIQERKLQSKAKSVAIKSLGGSKTNAYKKISRKVFSGIWRDFNNHFSIPRYSELPRKQFEQGMKFLGMWQPDTSLRIEVEDINNQQTIEEVI